VPFDALTPADEGRHPPGSGRWWQESWWFDVFSPDGSFGACTWLTLLPNQRRAWYWCVLVRDGEALLHAADLEVPWPSTGLTVRSTSLWAEHLCEAPFAQWTVANETYAVALDDADEALGRAYGRQEPIACDFEWYAVGTATRTANGYVQQGEVHGVIELARGPLTTETPASRGHSWGEHDWTRPGGQPASGARAPVRLDIDGVAVALEQVVTGDGWRRWWHVMP
jgi:hypothetical protein